jgi:hypothetical protein
MNLQSISAGSFGSADRVACPICRYPMGLIRRTPHSELGADYERQTFACYECGHEVERSADKIGHPYA